MFVKRYEKHHVHSNYNIMQQQITVDKLVCCAARD